mmetsp:Transcript_22280/g.47385  ORF Transcript_22280/g.47385 Transcript_22280/m.47385 type:complete len:235 (+) Transcript_22280:53-757(+)
MVAPAALRGAMLVGLLPLLLPGCVVGDEAPPKRRGEVKPPAGRNGRRGRGADPAAVARAEKATVDDLEIEWLERDTQCTERARKGSTVSFEHKGWIHSVEGGGHEDIVGKQMDANPEGEPLKFVVGGGNLLRGMELAIEGMCAGDKISALIPPFLAYDDPTRNFAKSPAPVGTTVRYEISVVAVEGGSAASAVAGNPMLLAAVGFLAVAALGIFAFVKKGGSPKKETKERKKRR